jgi:hypothetical protein
MSCPDPSLYFQTTPLNLRRVAPSVWLRIIDSRFARTPLGFNPTAPSRFSDPTGVLGVVYLAATMQAAFRETLVRDRNAGRLPAILMDRAEVSRRSVAEISVIQPLKLADLTDDPLFKMGVPTDACMACAHACGQKWSSAFHRHPDQPDGLIFPSRLTPGVENIVVYDRGLTKLRVDGVSPLSARPERADLLAAHRVILV